MMDFVGSGALSLFAFVFVISLVVVIHELGHYGAGRFFGVHAEAFSIGFGPTLAAWRAPSGTLWRIAALPLGGYVKFRGDLNPASVPDGQIDRSDPQADTVMHFKPVWQRAIIVAAGPVANFALAVVLFTILGLARGEFAYETYVTDVLEGAPAEEAGFEIGDQILTLDGQTSGAGGVDVVAYVAVRAGQPIEIEVLRQGRVETLTATPRRQLVEDRFGGERPLGRLGIEVSVVGTGEQICCTLFQAPLYGVSETAETTAMIAGFVGRLITGKASVELMNGPLGIATIAGQVANVAVESPAAAADQPAPSLAERLARLVLGLLTLSALLSVTLGLMNLLPIPVLDGGHLVYYAYEAVTQRPPSPALQQAGFGVGLLLIVGMMVVATWNDLSYLRGLFS
jgi:regulator of sigma E protease